MECKEEKERILENENQTYGCKHSNPDICKNNGIEGKCAFASDDNICRNPPVSWKKKFKIIEKENKNGI